MKKNGRVVWAAAGMACVIFLVLACVQSILYNEGRLVYPMELSSYVFRPADLPMILALAAIIIYVLALAFLLIRTILRRNQRVAETNTTRTLDPRLGWLGLLGLLGFLGFWSYGYNGSIFPFCFFLFFGFFGFFFEGKRSNTLMDERFRENRTRAQLAAYRVGYVVIFLLVLLLGHGLFLGNMEYTLIIVTCVLALTVAAVQILSQYLLYRYDRDDQLELEEEDQDGGV